MKKGAVVISIPQLCSQRFEDMQPDAHGRFCGSCKKTVIDFSAMSDARLLAFFTKNTGELCGRFHKSQVDKEIAPVVIRENIFRRTAAIAAMFITSLSVKTASAQKQKPSIEVDMINTRPAAGSKIYDFMFFKGNTIGKNNAVVSGVEIVLKNGDNLQRIYSDSSGAFSLLSSERIMDGATLTFTYYDFKKEILLNPVSNNVNNLVIKVISPEMYNPSEYVMGAKISGLTITNTNSFNAGGLPGVWDILQ